jgi:nicotinamide mononucleotide transporter
MKKLLRSLVQSSYLDLLGVAIILGVCLYKGFHETIYYQGEIHFGTAIEDLYSMMRKGAFPLGIVSCIGAIFSVLSTRLIGKQNNMGNWIGVFTTVNSGALDYMFGNGSAVITYPLTFLIMVFAVDKWKSKDSKIRNRDLQYYLIIIAGIVTGFGLVYLGAYLFGGITSHSFLILVSVVFGLSIGANVCSALKYEETWFSWVLYNIVQLVKNIMQLNIANVAKYIFYLFNAFITLFDWKLNRDVDSN